MISFEYHNFPFRFDENYCSEIFILLSLSYSHIEDECSLIYPSTDNFTEDGTLMSISTIGSAVRVVDYQRGRSVHVL